MAGDELQRVIEALRNANRAAIQVKCAYHPNHPTHALAGRLSAVCGELGDAISDQEGIFKLGGHSMTRGPTGKG